MALTPVAFVVSEASLFYVMTIFLDTIKAFHMVQRVQVMSITDKEHSVETAGILKALMPPSTVTTTGDETKLARVVNFGLAREDTAFPVLYSKEANILMRQVLHVLKKVDDGEYPEPLKGIADIIALQF